MLRKAMLFFAVVSILFGFTYIFQNQLIWGDEFAYIRISHQVASRHLSVLSIVPGTFGLYWWPPLPYSIYSFFASDKLVRYYSGNDSSLNQYEFQVEVEKFIRRISYLNMFFLLVSGYMVYLISLRMGLMPRFAILASFMTMLNPRTLFYLQALWPELMHFTLLLLATYLFLRYMDDLKVVFLLLSSILYGYCALTKGIVEHYFWILLIVLFLHARIRKEGYREVLIVLLVFLLPYLAITDVQKGVNMLKYNSFSLSLNTWVNVEAGLIPREKIRGEGYDDVFQRYFDVSSDPVEREKLSRERVLKYLRGTSWMEIVSHQTRQYLGLMNSSFLLSGIDRKRWLNAQYLVLPGIGSVFLSWVLFVLGSIGGGVPLIHPIKNLRLTVLSVYLLYYLSALWVVGFNPRFFMQAVPFLSIFTARVLQILTTHELLEPAV